MVAAALVVATACVGGPTTDPTTSSQTPEPTTSRDSSAPEDESTRLPKVTLTADLSSRFSGWDLVTTIPFGDRDDQLGVYIQKPGHEGLDVVPPSFAVAPDDSIWILDAFKRRLAHYSASGAYLGQAGRFPWRSVWDARDVVWSGGRLYVLLGNVNNVAASVVGVDPHHHDRAVPITLDGDPAVVYVLVAGTDPLIGEVHGYALGNGHALGEEPPEWATLDVPGDGSVEGVPGVPLRDGTSMAVRAVGVPEQPGRIDVLFERDDLTSVLPFQVQVVDHREAPAIEVIGMSTVIAGSAPHGIACYVKLSAARAVPGGGVAGGRWFLQVNDDGSALAWERLPDPEVGDEGQERHLTVGPDGEPYLMVPDPTGVSIYRRVQPGT